MSWRYNNCDILSTSIAFKNIRLNVNIQRVSVDRKAIWDNAKSICEGETKEVSKDDA